MRLHYFQHVTFEWPARIVDWARARGIEATGTKLWEDDPPGPDAYDFLVVMGGPMGVDDEHKHPWLATEKRAIAAALEAGKTILGVCLGAQLVADLLGAKVYRGPEQEIGFFPVILTDEGKRSPFLEGVPEAFTPLHWHRDMFDIPAGAERLARSKGCENQMYAMGDRIVGIQFHLEMNPEHVEQLIEQSGDKLKPGRYVQSRDTILAGVDHLARGYDILYAILDRLHNHPSES